MFSQIIEIGLILIIIGLQLYFAKETYEKIKSLNSLIPNIKSFNIKKIYVPIQDLENNTSGDILNNITKYESELQADFNNPMSLEEQERYGTTHYTLPVKQISIIVANSGYNTYLNNFINSINTYLLRNSGAPTDFNLVKDIVERNVNQLEEEINSTVSVPLYLGLLGTMVGIIVGLWGMGDLGEIADSNLIGNSINKLLQAVTFAMVASFMGLFWTILNSSISIPKLKISFKDAKNNLERNKNDFYTFVQTELLPKINNSLDSSFEILQKNLTQFNTDLKSNLSLLNQAFAHNQNNVNSQQKTAADLCRAFEKLETLDIANVSKFNLTVWKQMEKTLLQVDSFNTNIDSLSRVIESSDKLTDNINTIIGSTRSFDIFLKKLDERFTTSDKLLRFLDSHFRTLEDYKQYVQNTVKEFAESNNNLVTNAIIDVGSSMSDVFAELKDHINKSTANLTDFTIEEIKIFEEAMLSNKSNLSNLEFLKSLNDEVKNIKKTSLESNSTVNSNMQTLNAAMLRVAVTLEEMQKLSITHNVSKLFGFKTSSQSEITKLNQKSNN